MIRYITNYHEYRKWTSYGQYLTEDPISDITWADGWLLTQNIPGLEFTRYAAGGLTLIFENDEYLNWFLLQQ